MKESGDVFKRFRESFSKLDGHFHILEQKVPVEKQMEYFRYSEKVKREELPQRGTFEDIDAEELENTLYAATEQDVEEVKYVLACLAGSKNVKAYRVLEEYSKHPMPEVADWAHMALMECRISLESELSDQKQIYISTGLGGKGEMLRFYILILSKDKKPFEEYQRQVIEREFAYMLSGTDCEIERLVIGEQYVELLFLISVRADLKLRIDQVINECNQYGNFLSDTFTITNVKELSEEEIQEIINKEDGNRNSKTSD